MDQNTAKRQKLSQTDSREHSGDDELLDIDVSLSFDSDSDSLDISAVDRMKVFLASGDEKVKLKTAAKEKTKKQEGVTAE